LLPASYKNKREEKIYKKRGKREIKKIINKNKDNLKAPLYV
jgi:hypothetical protein